MFAEPSQDGQEVDDLENLVPWPELSQSSQYTPMRGKSGRVSQDIVEFFDQSLLTRVSSDNSLRGDGTIWTDHKAISAALRGEFSLVTLDNAHTVQGLAVNEMNHKGRLSRPASLDGGLADYETSSNSSSRADIRASSIGTFLTAPEQSAYHVSREIPRTELEATTSVIQEYPLKEYDEQQNANGQGSPILDRTNAGTITSQTEGTLAEGFQVSPDNSQATVTFQNELFILSAGSPKRKPVPFRIQDDRLKRPISPATYNLKIHANSQTVASHSFATFMKEYSSPLAVPPAKPLYKELCSSGLPPSGHNELQHSLGVDSPYPVQARVSWRLGDEEGLESPITGNDKDRQRFLDWVNSVPEKPFSDEETCKEQKLSIEKHASVRLKTTKEQDENKETCTVEKNPAFDRFWSKAGTKTITPGFFSPAKGHFSPPTSPDSQLQPSTATTTAHSYHAEKNSDSQSVLTTDSEDSDLYWSSKGPQGDLYDEELARVAQQDTSPKKSASVVQRIKHSPRPLRQPKVRQQLSNSSTSSELSSEELVLGPVKYLGASVSLDHLRLAPISKTPTFDDHLHPAQRANPYFNPSDNVDDGITLVPRPRPQDINTLFPEYRPCQDVYSMTGEAPRLSRDFAKSPMRDEFAKMAKEKSTKAVLKKTYKGAKHGVKKFLGRGTGGAELNCFAK